MDRVDLTGRSAIVTGGARGIGRAIALGTAAHGERQRHTIATVLAAAFMLLTGPTGLVIPRGRPARDGLAHDHWRHPREDPRRGRRDRGRFDGIKLVLQVWRGVVVGISDAVNGIIGVLNTFIDGYNAIAGKTAALALRRRHTSSW